MGVLFLCVWGVVAIGLGALFLFRPDVVADRYITSMSRFRLTNRWRETLAPRSVILAMYRVAGAVGMLAGIVLPALALTGVIDVGKSS